MSLGVVGQPAAYFAADRAYDHDAMRLERVGFDWERFGLARFEARIMVVKLLRACGGCLGARRR